LGEACNEAAFTFTSNLNREKRLIASQNLDDDDVLNEDWINYRMVRSEELLINVDLHE
jgi:hypothetical protein